jgi:ATP-dependent Clp protease ATP-binding subunit ClpA
MIQKEVGDRLALALLEGAVGDGDTVTLDADEEGFRLD